MLEGPRIREAATRLGDPARDAGWSHEEYRAAVLDRAVAARDTISQLATGTFLAKAENVVLLGPPGDREDPPRDFRASPT